MKGTHMGVKLGGGGRIRWQRLLRIAMLLACLVPVVLVYRYFRVCAGPSSVALREFPLYGGAWHATIPNPAGYPEDCSGGMIWTTDDTDSILSYYREQLTMHGWSVLPEYNETPPEEEHITYRAVIALRGNLCYVAGVEQVPGRDATNTKGHSVSVRNPATCQAMQQHNAPSP